MRIERRQHAVDRGFDELRVIGFLDVVGTHALEHVAKQVELFIKLGILRRGSRVRLRDVQKRGRAGQARHQQECPERVVYLAHYPYTFCRPVAHQHHNFSITRAPSRSNLADIQSQNRRVADVIAAGNGH